MNKTNELDEQSILSNLMKYDGQIKEYFNELRGYQSKCSEIETYYEHVEGHIKNSFDDIRIEVCERLENLKKYFLTNQERCVNEATKYNSEIGLLAQENSDLYERIKELKEKIKNMEAIIGESEIKFIANTQ